jgi:methionyl aminopeptidase
MTPSLRRWEYYARASRSVNRALAKAQYSLHAGIPLLSLAELIEREIVCQGALPAFPVSLAVNEEVAYCSPSTATVTTLERGDLLKIDVGAHVAGYIVDTAITLEIETARHARLIRAAERTLQAALRLTRDGSSTSFIAQHIEHCIAREGFRTVCAYYGHSIDRFKLHGAVTIARSPDTDVQLSEGDVIAVEVMPISGRVALKPKDAEIYSLQPHFDVIHLSIGARNLFSHLIAAYGVLPFSVRWLDVTESARYAALCELLKNGGLVAYPRLQGAHNSVVAHVERSIIVTKNGCIAL